MGIIFMKKINLNFRSPSAILLVLANLVPVYGVFFLNWKVFPLLFLFWLENVYIGFFNVLKMIMCQPQNGANWLGKLFLIPFFTFHYGMFTAVHGIFVIVLFGSQSLHSSGFPNLHIFQEIIKMNNLQYAALLLFLSHGFSFLWNYLGNKEYEKISLQSLMAKPYGRVIVLHFTILLGGFLLMALGSPASGLLLFIISKILMDVNAHSREHDRI